MIGAAFGLGFIIGPLVGGVLGNIDLRLPFWGAAVLALANFCYGAFVLPESLPPERRRLSHLGANLRSYVILSRDRSYLRYVLAAALMFASMFAYISGSSFVLQEVYGLSAQQFSLVFGVNGLGIVLCGQVNGVLVGRVANEHTLLGISLVAGAVGGFGVLASTIAELPLGVLLACLFTVVAMIGPVLANATSLALADHASAAGAASSLQGLLQFLVGGVVASAMGLFGDGTAVPMGVAMCVSATAALVVFGRHSPRRRSEAQAPGGDLLVGEAL